MDKTNSVDEKVGYKRLPVLSFLTQSSFCSKSLNNIYSLERIFLAIDFSVDKMKSEISDFLNI